MGKAGQESETKPCLVSKICFISTARVSCIHRNVSARSCFIDWYRVLEVGEDAGFDLIRKQYHKLALQIHPDKNTHPKAEIAFKLISEAYTCLSNESKRREFDSERRRSLCTRCNRVPYATSNSCFRTNSSSSRSFRSPKSFKDIRDRFKEENDVIESCLRTSNNSCVTRNESPVFDPNKKESPVFDPSDYLFEGYPHVRSRIFEKSGGCWYLQQKGKNVHDLPVFENKSDWRTFRSKSTCVRS